eukprot:573469-Pyramimonas_sp.AAC.1
MAIQVLHNVGSMGVSMDATRVAKRATMASFFTLPNGRAMWFPPVVYGGSEYTAPYASLGGGLILDAAHVSRRRGLGSAGALSFI